MPKSSNNGWGGARPGSGPKPKAPTLLDVGQHADPLDFLRSVMQNEAADMKLRLLAAATLMPYLHSKQELGKKDIAAAAGKKAASGRFAASAPPLRVVS